MLFCMKLGRYILVSIVVLISLYQLNTIQIDKDIVVSKGDGYDVFFRAMSWRDASMMKIYLKLHYPQDPTVYPGVYRFEKSLNYSSFLKVISVPPKPVMAKITLLEWWSSRDADALLVKKWYITPGDYRSYITNPDIIKQAIATYPFLPDTLTSLEWFLYPDTYHIDLNKGRVVEQLVQLQLQTFLKKVWLPNQDAFVQFNAKLQKDSFDFKMSTYSIIKLASIIENEEKNNQNKQTIAGVFLNRIYNGMQLGADVTLCYGKSITYDQCTPSFIVNNLYDDTNPYNTRRQVGLPPTPISNPALQSIEAVLYYKMTNYVYYLHDANGKIYYGTTLQEHNTNKERYLK